MVFFSPVRVGQAGGEIHPAAAETHALHLLRAAWPAAQGHQIARRQPAEHGQDKKKGKKKEEEEEKGKIKSLATHSLLSLMYSPFSCMKTKRSLSLFLSSFFLFSFPFTYLHRRKSPIFFHLFLPLQERRVAELKQGWRVVAVGLQRLRSAAVAGVCAAAAERLPERDDKEKKKKKSKKSKKEKKRKENKRDHEIIMEIPRRFSVDQRPSPLPFRFFSNFFPLSFLLLASPAALTGKGKPDISMATLPACTMRSAQDRLVNCAFTGLSRFSALSRATLAVQF